MARPSKLNEELITKFAAEVEDGLPFIYCCDLLAVTRPSFTTWMKQGETDFHNEKESLEAAFFNAINCAYAKFIKKSKNKIAKNDGAWSGTAWWLERTNKLFVLNYEGDTVTEPVIVNPSIKPNNK